MNSQQPTTSSWSVFLAAVILFLFGAWGTWFGLEDFWKQPSLGEFLFVYFLGVWPLYIAAVAVYALLVNSADGVVHFPSRTPRFVLVANVLVFGPLALALGWLGTRILGAAIADASWKALAVLAIIGPLLLQMTVGVRAIFRRSVSEFADGGAENREDGQPSD